ncbi:ABC transporter permease subunit [Entomospira culicis]|uniref:Maltose/maltodextrin transport system permease protein n=1 Tax=Entomospira culicis TaxID=2719989 RepID=A0A968GHT6_9SPIO|nr:ABC transporter permease subunit [Entomospira culicis]NIZ19882.1 ABC transporter permease subunit [Entomospira culicis]NIZ70096.1 ABC transporter permease subunit [Entomospira culicis]WDI37200.1 ABC transporter permease subunit [Entomospira culicis]WDI38829.1 ABC transporter permease subunit [Entomospira culicis]
MKHKSVFLSSLILPGSGHILLKRWGIGIGGILLFLMEILTIVQFIIPTFSLLAVKQPNGSITIGAEPYVNDSFIILLGAVVGTILLVVFALIHYTFALNARKMAREIAEFGKAVSIKESFKAVSGELMPNLVTLPKFLLIITFIIIPSILSIIVAFTNYRMPILPPAFLIEWRGLENFARLFTDDRMSALFRDTLSWTVVWTFSSSILVIALGTILAVIANNKYIKGKTFFRTVFILPWAVPAFLTILIFQYFFSKLGGMNSIVLPFLTGQAYDMDRAIGFLIVPELAKITIILIQGWLGFPYVFILVTGVLQTIPADLYEASSIDGGNAFTNFFQITLPLILISVAPVFITQFTFNFNNVVIIYMLTESVVKPIGAEYGPLETIASLGFQLMMKSRFNEAAVFTLIVSTIVGVIVLFSWLKTGAFKNEEVM